jgi:endonuclease-8
MPEGDTIHRTATRLAAILVGKPIDQLTQSDRVPDLTPLVGRTVVRVEPRGKHLLIHCEGELTLHTHMGMTGSWHTYRTGEAWRKPVRQAWIVLQCGVIAAVCFTPKLVELLSATRLRRHPWLSRLGPDILDEGFDVAAAVLRFRRHPLRPIGVAMLDQSIVCGIGNVYKSELLFLQRLNPFVTLASISDDRLFELIQETRKWMVRNLEGRIRTTRYATDGPRCWVYDRAGKPCLKCGTLIAMERQGDLGRSTYWCPECQSSTETTVPC